MCPTGSPQGDHLGSGVGGPVPRLLPRLLRPASRRRRRTGPGPPLAGRVSQDRLRDRARAAGGHRPRNDVTGQDPPDPHGAPRGAISPVPHYLLPDSAEVDGDGRLWIAGVDMVELSREVGTPVFVYDEEHLRRRCREAVTAFGEGVAYASKAFLCRAMARLAHDEGMCIDVSTGGETYVALESGVPGNRLILHGNNKSDAELVQALSAGVRRIVIDSFDEIDRLERLAAGGRPPALIR